MAVSKGTAALPRSTWLGAALRFALPAPLAVALFLRGVDALYFEPALNEAGLGHEVLIGGIIAAGLLLCVLSIRRPSLAVALAAIAFGSLKQLADAAIPMPDLGKPTLALVTGANAGIGKAVVAELSRQGHTVLMGCRSPRRCLAARTDILASSPGVRPEQLLLPGDAPEGGLSLDLSRLSAVEAWAAAAAEVAGGWGGVGLL
eukprot:scaffold19679_cov124-Isochrysis_galbana.AAC.1